MSYEVVDFRKPGRVSEDIGHMLSAWQQRMREALEIRWARCISCELKISPVSPAPLTGEELRQLGESSIAYRVDVAARPTLVVMPRVLALGLVGEVLGDSAAEAPDDRPLTDIEATCLDFLIDELRAVLQDSQNFSPPRELNGRGQVQLKELHKEFPKNVTNTDVGLSIVLPHGLHTLRWILPQDVTLEMVAAAATQNSANDKSRLELERHVLRAAGELVVRLGKARVQLAKLANLKPGDIIKLDQRIDDPLVAELGGQKLFRGWGGRIGKQQVFQIDTVLDHQTST
jgi:flagellar motor switch protein FliM